MKLTARKPTLVEVTSPAIGPGYIFNTGDVLAITGAVPVALAAATLLASLLPARRAAKTEPLLTLRAD